MKTALKFFALLLLTTSCASSYKAIGPGALHYQNLSLNDEVEFSYRYDVLNEKGNKKLSKKESKNAIKVVAVKVVNNSSQDFIFGSDKHIYSSDRQIALLEPAFVYKQLKQSVPIYLLYLLFTPMNFYSTNSEGETSSTPIGYILGPGLTLINVLVASSANADFKNELETNYLLGKTIKAGETAHGFIAIIDTGYNTLTLK